MTTIQLSLCIDTTDPLATLGAEVWIDNQQIFNSDHVAGLSKITHSVSDDDADRVLKIILKNKTPEHTRIDDLGHIVKDARLIISQVTFDEIDLGQILYDLAEYSHDHNGNGPQVQEKFYGEVGCNGSVSLKFSTPIYLWLLENM